MKESFSRVVDAVVVATSILTTAIFEVAALSNDVEKIDIGRENTLVVKGLPTLRSLKNEILSKNLQDLAGGDYVSDQLIVVAMPTTSAVLQPPPSDIIIAPLKSSHCT